MNNDLLMRSFIAINIPEWLKDKLGEIQERLRGVPGEISWARKPSFHLTLKFLSNILPGQIQAITEVIRTATYGIPPFPLRITGLGIFPHINRPRVVWIGIDDSTGNLKNLQYNLENGLEKLGFEREEREFSPHLTLGRVKLLKNKVPLIKLIETYKLEGDWVFQAENVSLMKSELKPTGAIYSIMEEVRLETGS